MFGMAEIQPAPTIRGTRTERDLETLPLVLETLMGKTDKVSTKSICGHGGTGRRKGLKIPCLCQIAFQFWKHHGKTLIQTNRTKTDLETPISGCYSARMIVERP